MGQEWLTLAKKKKHSLAFVLLRGGNPCPEW